MAWTRQPQRDGEKGTDVRYVEEGERTGLGAGLVVGVRSGRRQGRLPGTASEMES